MILADDNFATIIGAVREGRVVWDNLRKVLLINTPINNAQGMSVLFGIICGLENTPLTPIQVLYCNLICAVTLGFVAAVEPAEDGIMQKPPRRVGKRIIGRFLLLRIIIATIILVATTVGSVFWVQSLRLQLGANARPGLEHSFFRCHLCYSECSLCLQQLFQPPPLPRQLPLLVVHWNHGCSPNFHHVHSCRQHYHLRHDWYGRCAVGHCHFVHGCHIPYHGN